VGDWLGKRQERDYLLAAEAMEPIDEEVRA
jgi:hypothetical protein